MSSQGIIQRKSVSGQGIIIIERAVKYKVYYFDYIIRRKSVSTQGKIITDIYIIKNYALDGHEINNNNLALHASSSDTLVYYQIW